MVDACTAVGALPFYGPYGDIKDVEGCETQFRAAFLLGCVGAWSLHPAQIDIAKSVFSPDPDEVAFAKKVIEAIPDGRGVHMIDGKMQDDATWKQCQVMVDLAEMLAAQGPGAAPRPTGLSRRRARGSPTPCAGALRRLRRPPERGRARFSRRRSVVGAATAAYDRPRRPCLAARDEAVIATHRQRFGRGGGRAQAARSRTLIGPSTSDRPQPDLAASDVAVRSSSSRPRRWS